MTLKKPEGPTPVGEDTDDNPFWRYARFWHSHPWYWRAWQNVTWRLFVLGCKLRGKDPMQEFANRVHKATGEADADEKHAQ